MCILKFGMPYRRMPPGTGQKSNTVQRAPASVSSSATARPAGPEPMIATFSPVSGAISGSGTPPFSRWKSAMNDSSSPDRYRRLLPVGRRPDREADDAGPLAERLLRTQPAAHVRQIARLAENSRRAVDVALFEEQQRARDVVVRSGRRPGRGLSGSGCSARPRSSPSRDRIRGRPRPSCGRVPPAPASAPAGRRSAACGGYRWIAVGRSLCGCSLADGNGTQVRLRSKLLPQHPSQPHHVLLTLRQPVHVAVWAHDRRAVLAQPPHEPSVRIADHGVIDGRSLTADTG